MTTELIKNHRHFIVHKPYGMLSQFVLERKRKKTLLGDLFDFPIGTMSIGRLDVATEGLLFLTTDGMVSYKVRSKKVEKEYYVLVDGIVSEEAIEKLKGGVEIGFEGKKYMTLPCNAFVLESDPNFHPRTQKIRDDRHGPSTWISITITEGKYRQVRKMTAAVGLPTLRLVRVRIGKIRIDKLHPGLVREVKELKY